MRTTITIDDDILAAAQDYTGLKEKSAVVRVALEAFVQREAARRLARLGGTMPDLKGPAAAAVEHRVIIADTSIWIDHFRLEANAFAKLLDDEAVLLHPFILGEIVLGNLPRRAFLLRELRRVPKPIVAAHVEMLELIERRSLFGTGLGYTDAHILASALLMEETYVWTRDKRLKAAAERLGVAAAGLD